MTPRELQNWLEERPEETRHREAFWIGLRCMLRMLPRYFSQMPEIKRGEKQQFLTSGLGLAMMVEWSFSGVDSVVQGDGEIHLQNINLDFLLSLAARAKSGLDILPGSAIADMVNALDPYQDALQSASRENDDEEQNWSRSLNALTECAVKQVRKGNELYGEDIIGPMFTESIDADVERVLVGTNMANIPLWSPRSLEISDQAWPKSGGPWDFWIDWYQRALDGTPQPMDLLEKIALQSDEFWQGSDAEVNTRIAEIVAEWEAGQKLEAFIEQHPYANRIEADPAKKKLVSVPAETVDLTDIVDRIRQAAKDFTAGCRKDKSPNKIGEQMQSAFAPVIADIRRDLRRHRTDPLKLFDSMELACRAMGRIARAEGFPPEGPSGRLMDELATSCEDICIASPEVLETQRHRIAVRTELFSFEQKIVALRLCAGLHENAEGHLRATAALAINTILDSASSEDAKKHAWYFMIAVIPRGARAMRQADMKPADKEQSDSMLKRAAEAGNQLSSIDRGIDAAQEMAGEGANWVDGVLNLFGSGGFPGIGG